MSEPSFRVLWTETAVRDLEDIISFIATDSPGNAAAVLARLKERAAALEANPMRGRVVPELALFGITTWREMIVKPHRLIYRVEADSVFVLAVLDGRRDLEDLLLQRLVRS